MAFPHYLTQSASGLYVFRMRVPADLRGIVGRDFIKRGLGHNLLSARLAALDLSGRYAAAFDVIRGRGLEKKINMAEVLANIAENGKRDYTIIRPDGLRIEARDPADHARAMEALEAIGRFDMAARPVAPPTAPVSVVAEAITLGKARDAWLKSLAATTDPKTLAIKGTAINGLVDFMGANCLVHTIGRPDLARFYQHLRDRGNSTPAIYNKQSYLGGKGSFFDWAINSGHYPAGDNPAKGHVRYTEKEKRQRKKHGFKAFDLEQVRVLYAPEHFSRLSPGARWAALLGLYTGARASEVGQLHTVDVSEVDSVPAKLSEDQVAMAKQSERLAIAAQEKATKEAERQRQRLLQAFQKAHPTEDFRFPDQWPPTAPTPTLEPSPGKRMGAGSAFQPPRLEPPRFARPKPPGP